MEDEKRNGAVMKLNMRGGKRDLQGSHKVQGNVETKF